MQAVDNVKIGEIELFVMAQVFHVLHHVRGR